MTFNPNDITATFSYIWRPGGTTLGNVLATWAEVQAVIASHSATVLVFVDDSISPATVPAGTTDCENRVTFAAYNTTPLGTAANLILPDGAILLNPGTFTLGLTVTLNGSAQPNLQFSNHATLRILQGASINNQGTQPATRLIASQQFSVEFALGGSYQSGSVSPMVDMPAAGAETVAIAIGGSNFGINNFVTGIAGTTFEALVDAGIKNIPTNPGFSGTTVTNLVDNAEFVEYAPSVPADWSPVPTEVAQALDILAANGTLPPTNATQAVYVNKGGNDTTGNGSILKPYLTIPKALSTITDAATGKRYVVICGPGNYAEDISMIPWVWIEGADVITTRITGNVTLDATWNPSPDNDTRAGFSSLTFAGGPYTFDFNAVSSNQGKLYFNNVRFNTSPTFTAFSAINQVSMQNCYMFAGYTQNGINMSLDSVTFINGGTCTINSINDGRNLPSLLSASGGSSDGPFVVNWASNGGTNVNNIEANLFSFPFAGGMTLTGAEAVVSATADSIVSPVTLVSSAPSPTLLTPAFGVGYTPSTPADWNPVPTQVAQALDELAARNTQSFWTQADWYVDWTSGNDNNDGLSPGTAVKTVMGGVVAKWGTVSPILPQTTTLHILTPQPDNAEEIILAPYLSGEVNFVITGTPVVVATGLALGTVTAKNRATNQQFSAAGFTSGAVGDLVHNTTAGKNSYCFIRTLAGAVAELTQPLAPLTQGTDTLFDPTPAEVDTWATGDTVDVLQPCNLNLRSITILGGGNSDSNVEHPGLWCEYINVPDGSGTSSESTFAPLSTQYLLFQSCSIEAYTSTQSGEAFLSTFTNCYLAGASINQTYIIGGATTTAVGLIAFGTNWLDADFIIDASSGFSGETVIGVVDLCAALALHGGNELRLDNLFGYGAVLWGTGSVDVQPGGTFYNTSGTTWAASVTVATLELDSGSSGASFDPTSGLWTPRSIAITAANIDAHGGLQDPVSGARFTM